MTTEEFIKTLQGGEPPAGLTAHLKSLWYDGKNDWNRSHDIIQNINDTNAAWIHAYLHRKEGDIFNADYWYRRANRPRPDISLKNEWKNIVETLL